MEHFLETWGYLAVFVLSFISSMGLPVGAEVAIIYGGVLASGQVPNEPHHLNLVLVIVVAVLAEVLGSLAGYLIGYFGGRPLVDRVGKYVLLTHRDLDRAEAWFSASRRTGRPFRPVHPAPTFIRVLRRGSGRNGYCQVPSLHRHRLHGLVCRIGDHRLRTREQLPPRPQRFSYVGYVLAAVAVLAVVVLFIHRLRVMRAERGEQAERA